MALLGAAGPDSVSTSTGIVVFGNVLPKLSIVPALTQVGVASPPRPGADRVAGFDRSGRKLFEFPFADDGYSYYLFAPVPIDRLKRLQRLRVTAGSATQTLDAAAPAKPAATARALADGRVAVAWNARSFPRLSCVGEGGGSPAPLMLGGTFTAANERGKALLCDFSDGVKTVHSGVRVPIAGR